MECIILYFNLDIIYVVLVFVVIIIIILLFKSEIGSVEPRPWSASPNVQHLYLCVSCRYVQYVCILMRYADRFDGKVSYGRGTLFNAVGGGGGGG